MKHNFQQEAENYTKVHRKKKRWYKVVTCLAAMVVFCTTYALILPAVTMENSCQIPEHTHTQECYTRVTSVTKRVLVCSEEHLNIHQHTESCYDEKNNLVCGYADFVVHRHDSSCYDENGDLWCPLPEIEVHTHSEGCFDSARAAHEHTEECYTAEGELSCQEKELSEPIPICGKDEIILHTHQPYVSLENPGCYDKEGNLICGQVQVEEHQHTESCFETIEEPADTESLTCTNTEENHVHGPLCYGTWELTCSMEEHTHNEACTPPNEQTTYYCGKTEHTHGDSCFDTDGKLQCTLEEHVHDVTCTVSSLPEEDEVRVKKVISMIEELPTSVEIEETLTAFEESNDTEGEEAYYQEISEKVRYVYSYYEDLGEELKEQVTNREKLLELLWLCSADTLEITDTLTVYQVNRYELGGKATLAYSKTDGQTVGTVISGITFTYWKAITVEEQDGTLRVTAINMGNVSKEDIGIPVNGFVVFVYGGTVTASVGDYVKADFDYTVSGSNTNGLGTITFSDTPLIKADKDNSEKLSIVQGADTRDIIEVNLYDYDSSVNSRYYSDKSYPGFQQDKGQLSVESTYSSNFGNNITEDLAAGCSDVTVENGDNINATVNAGAGLANSPISGMMQSTLSSDGYPVLANGKKLDYLWSSSDCAKKQNTQSINGLFQYNETTGAYTFNSRTNHAQFNSEDDTFTLYDQIISSNFIWYPFGNFLPFNDIVHESAQVSAIDRSYLQTIASTALDKYNNGQGDEYKTLSESMNSWISLMDKKYDGDWGAAEAMNEYFNGNGPGKKTGQTFDFASQTDLLANVYSIDFDEPTDFYFGMEMKMNFMQPKAGLTGKDGQQPMVFEFSGDDDVWVYIDGILVLDLSGIHRHVGGKIDFTNGKIYYQNLDVSTGDVGSYKEAATFQSLGLEVDSSGRLKDYSAHTFNFYYMERGAGSGVCRMNFNFPLLEKNTIAVTKELSVDDESKLPLLGDPDFKFQVMRENSDELFIGANTHYNIFNSNSEKIGEGVTDDNGVFVLKAGQTAVFDDIPESAGRYYVRELLDPDSFEQYGEISVSGSTQTTNYDVTVGNDTFKGVNSPVKDVSDGTTVFQFDNHVDTDKLGSLSITKTLKKYSEGQTGRQFSFYVKLDGKELPAGTVYMVGTETRQVETAGVITLAPDETAILSNILAGTTWSVQEAEESAADYYVTYTVNGKETEGPPSGVVQIATAVGVTVNNGEKGTSAEIPIRKILETPDGMEHTYTLRLDQVTDQTGKVLYDPAFYQELQLKITEDPVDDKFVINYPQNGLGTLPQKFYYRIAENEAQDDTETRYDPAVYVVEVTVAEKNGTLAASVTKAWKDGTEITVEAGAAPAVSFTNRLVYYELPETGGRGIIMYTVGGLLLVFAAVILLKHNYKKRRREGSLSS